MVRMLSKKLLLQFFHLKKLTDKRESNSKLNNPSTSYQMIRMWIKTTGEEGRYLFEIKITDTKDIKKIPADEWWKKVGRKSVYLASSSQDCIYCI